MGKSVVTGYWYLMGFHMAACHGPVDEVSAVTVGDRLAWSGSVTASGALSINNPYLFGGPDREGGVQGTLDVAMGEAGQLQNSYLLAKLGAAVPAFRGVLCFIARQIIVTANNPYVKPFAFKVRRQAKGWFQDSCFYPAKVAVGVGMNPSHIILQCLTDPDWGMGYPLAQMGASFTAAADTLHAEGFGLCLLWNQQAPIEDFTKQVLTHINGALFLDPATGLFELKLIRNDYTLGDQPLFDETNIVNLDSFSRPGWGETVNELNVVFKDVATNGDITVTAHDLANVQVQGGVVSQTRQYPGIPDAALAARVAQRDLTTLSTPLAKVRFRVNREGWNLNVGSVIRFSWAELGVTTIGLRIAGINLGDLEDGTIQVDAVEDVFALPAAGYTGAPPIGWVDPATVPQTPPFTRVEPFPLWALRQLFDSTDLTALDPTSEFVNYLAVSPGGVSYGFELWTKAQGASIYENNTGLGVWCPTCTLAAALNQLDPATFTYEADQSMALVTPPRYAYIDGEILNITAINTATKTLTVERGCMDTVPAHHAQGARVFVAEGFENSDDREYVYTEQARYELRTLTDSGVLASADAPDETLFLSRRQIRPYPPHRLIFNGSSDLYLPSARTPDEFLMLSDLELSWGHADRTDMIQALPVDDGTTPALEAGTTYTVTFMGSLVPGITQRFNDGNSSDTLAGALCYCYAASTGATIGGSILTPALNSNGAGVYAWEVTVGPSDSLTNFAIGIQNETNAQGGILPTSATQAVLYLWDGRSNNKSTVAAYGAAYADGDVIGVVVDGPGRTVTFHKNGVSQGTITVAGSGVFFGANTAWAPRVFLFTGGTAFEFNPGSSPFSFTYPGASPLWPTIAAEAAFREPVTYRTYTGLTGTSQIFAREVPDCGWINQAIMARLFDEFADAAIDPRWTQTNLDATDGSFTEAGGTMTIDALDTASPGTTADTGSWLWVPVGKVGTIVLFKLNTTSVAVLHRFFAARAGTAAGAKALMLQFMTSSGTKFATYTRTTVNGAASSAASAVTYTTTSPLWCMVILDAVRNVYTVLTSQNGTTWSKAFTDVSMAFMGELTGVGLYSDKPNGSFAFEYCKVLAVDGAVYRPQDLRVEAFSTRGGLNSLQTQYRNAKRVGFGYHFGESFGGI